MAIHETPRPRAHAYGGPGLNRTLAMVTNALRAWRNRREFYRLGEMTDAELHDIGLTRADLHVAVAAPFGRDPTTTLRALVDGRR